MSGIELAQRVRARPATRHIPMIAVTGWVMPADIVRARAAGFDVVLKKPFDPEALHAEIRRLLAVQAYSRAS